MAKDIRPQQLLVFLGCPLITGDSSGASSFLSGDQLFGRLMFLLPKISGKEGFSVDFLADFLLITQSRFFPHNKIFLRTEYGNKIVIFRTFRMQISLPFLLVGPFALGRFISRTFLSSAVFVSRTFLGRSCVDLVSIAGFQNIAINFQYGDTCFQSNGCWGLRHKPARSRANRTQAV